MIPFLLPVLETWEFSLIYIVRVWLSSWKLKFTKVWEPFYDWVLLEFLTPRHVYADLPAIHQLLFMFSYAGTGSCGGFCSSKLWFSLFTCLFNFGGSGLTCELTSLINLFRAVDFSVYLVLLIVKDGGDFWSPCMTVGNCKSLSFYFSRWVWWLDVFWSSLTLKLPKSNAVLFQRKSMKFINLCKI